MRYIKKFDLFIDIIGRPEPSASLTEPAHTFVCWACAEPKQSRAKKLLIMSAAGGQLGRINKSVIKNGEQDYKQGHPYFRIDIEAI